MPRPRKRAVSLVLGAGILIFLGTNVQAGWLFVLAAFLGGAALAGLVMPARMLHGLRVERRAPDEVLQLDEALVELTVRNDARGPRFSILVEDLHLDDARVFIPSLGRGASCTVSTPRRATRRGIVDVSEATLSSAAPFGVAERRRRVRVASRTLVLPAVVPLGTLPFIDSTVTVDRALRPAPRMGYGPEYLGVREYRPGDSMRHVHWPSTARVGSVVVREFAEETTRRLAIVLDASADAGDRWTPLDRSCCAAASIALAASANGQGTRLLVADRGDVEVVARSEGHDLLRRLAVLAPDPSVPFAGVVGRLATEPRGVETAVLVLPTWRSNDPSLLAPAVGALTARIPTVVCVLVEVTGDETSSRSMPTAAIDGLERDLRAAGAEVRVWREGDDLAAVLRGEVVPEPDPVGSAP